MTSLPDYRALQADRGYLVLYRETGDNACPACGGSNWIVGRTIAECAFCAAAIPLVSPTIGACTGPSEEKD